MGVGSVFESTNAIIGIPNTLASLTAVVSRLASTIIIASGKRRISLIPLC